MPEKRRETPTAEGPPYHIQEGGFVRLTRVQKKIGCLCGEMIALKNESATLVLAPVTLVDGANVSARCRKCGTFVQVTGNADLTARNAGQRVV